MKIFIVHIILISLFVIGCATSDSAMKEDHDEMMKSEDKMMKESDDEMMKESDDKMMKSDDKMMKSDDDMMMESDDKMMKSDDEMMKSDDDKMMETDDKMMKSDDDMMMKSDDDKMMKSESDQGKFAKATFAGGCFWCMEPPYDKLEGVISTTSGYTGGQKENPTYKEVSAGGTGHAEVVQVVYDPTKVSYEDLLEVFWKNIDPTVKDQQFCDHGDQYRTAIFYHSDEQSS